MSTSGGGAGTGAPELVLEDVDAYYGSAHVLFGVSLVARAGRTTAVIGRNGAGKTTLLRSIVHSGVRTTGRVRIGPTAVQSLPTSAIIRLGVQLVPEDRRVFTQLTVAQNLRLARQTAPRGRDAIPEAEVVQLFPMLGPLLGRKGSQLSGGEQQLVAIARAMSANPALLLLDEPSEGLAPAIVRQVGAAVGTLRERFDLTMILAEQNQRFALSLSDDVCVIDSGRIVYSGAVQSFWLEETQQRVRRALGV